MIFLEGDQFEWDRCLSLLNQVNLGRIGFVLGKLPVVFPVRYLVQKRALVFGLSVDQLAGQLNGAMVALQADGFEEDMRHHWTVLGVGPAASVPSATDDDSDILRQEVHLFRVRPQILSGRWLDASK